jgi:ATP-dependent DNA helicase RecG
MIKTAGELLEELNTLDEHVTIEAKTGSDVGNSIMETVCAFANEPGLGGGYILLGAKPATDSFWPVYEAVGVPDPDTLQQELATQCANTFNVVIRPQIRVGNHDGKTFLVVFVPEVSAQEKPVHFKNQPLPRGAMRRIGSTDQHCTDDDMVLFYTDRHGQTYDEHVLADCTLSDIDSEAVNLYRKLRREADVNAEELMWSDDDLLMALGAVKEQNGIRRPTVAGLLLFGCAQALRRVFPMLRIDYIRVPGIKWVKDPDHRFDTVEIRAPLLRAIQRIHSAVLDDLPKAFSLPAGEIQGREIPRLPDRVIREVIANAVMHRDYRVHGAIQIIRYANRLEIRNPGYSIKAEERLGEPGSQTRNPKIAAVLHEVRFAETKGSGIRVMRELMRENGLGPPVLQSDRTDNSFLAILLFHHFLSQDDLDWLKTFERDGLSEDEMKAMISAREVGAIDNSSYRNLNRDIDTLSASRHLRKLCDCDLLQKKGSGPKTFYVPTAKAMANWPPAAVDVLKSGEPRAKSGELRGKSGELKGKSEELMNEIPAELRERVEALGKKASISHALDVVLALLKWRELSVAEVAKILKRTPEYVRSTYVAPLVQGDLIQATNPEAPTDPRQRYRATRPNKANDGGAQ